MGINVQKIADFTVYSASQLPAKISSHASKEAQVIANGAKKLGSAMESLATQGKAHALKFVEDHPSKITSAIESSYYRGKEINPGFVIKIADMSEAVEKTVDGKKPVFTSKTYSPSQLVDLVTGKKAHKSAKESAEFFESLGSKTPGELKAWKAELLQKHANKIVK